MHGVPASAGKGEGGAGLSQVGNVVGGNVGLSKFVFSTKSFLVNIKLTRHQSDYIKTKLKTGHYSSASEVVREAIRTQEALETRQEALEQSIEEGIESGPAQVADEAYWRTLDAELEKEHGRRSRRAA